MWRFEGAESGTNWVGQLRRNMACGTQKPSSLNHYKTLNMDLCHLIHKRRGACRDANWIQFMLIANMAESIKRNYGFVGVCLHGCSSSYLGLRLCLIIQCLAGCLEISLHAQVHSPLHYPISLGPLSKHFKHSVINRRWALVSSHGLSSPLARSCSFVSTISGIIHKSFNLEFKRHWIHHTCFNFLMLNSINSLQSENNPQTIVQNVLAPDTNQEERTCCSLF